MKNFAKVHALWAKHRDERKLVTTGPAIFAKKAADEGALYVYEVIGEDWWTGGGVTAKDVVAALDAMKGVKKLNVYINSPGGDVFEAKAIMTNLQRFEAEKVMHIDGLAASAATYIAMAGDRIITAAHANWMIHEASGVAFGRADDHRALADLLDKQNLDLAQAYAAQTGKTIDEMLAVMNAETWLTADEALAAGFTDEVLAPPVDEAATVASAAKTSRLAAAILSTDERLAQIRRERRIGQFTNISRASPEKRDGQPERGSKK